MFIEQKNIFILLYLYIIFIIIIIMPPQLMYLWVLCHLYTHMGLTSFNIFIFFLDSMNIIN